MQHAVINKAMLWTITAVLPPHTCTAILHFSIPGAFVFSCCVLILIALRRLRCGG